MTATLTSPPATNAATPNPAAPEGTYSPDNQRSTDAQGPYVVGLNDRSDQGTRDTQRLDVAAVATEPERTAIATASPTRTPPSVPVPLTTSPPAKVYAATTDTEPEGIYSPDDQTRRDTPHAPVVGLNDRSDHATTDTQSRSVAAVSSSGSDRTANPCATPTDMPSFDPTLRFLADALDRTEASRTALSNQIGTLTRTEADKDGQVRGFGIPADSPVIANLALSLSMLRCGEKPKKDDANGRPCCQEHMEIKNLERVMRKHPLGPWVKAQKGVGDKQAARLLAAIGDPYWNFTDNCPRTKSGLRRYCGLDPELVEGSDTIRVARRRQRGQKANWSAEAKKRLWLVSKTCMKQLSKPCEVLDEDCFATHVDGCTCGGYRLVYDKARVKYADAVHNSPCVRCGPRGKPAETGSPLSAAHQLGRALRAVSQAILNDLWDESRKLHGAEA